MMIELDILFFTESGMTLSDLGINSESDCEFRKMTFIQIDNFHEHIEREGQTIVYSSGINYVCKLSYDELKKYLTNVGY